MLQDFNKCKHTLVHTDKDGIRTHIHGPAYKAFISPALHLALGMFIMCIDDDCDWLQCDYVY